MNKMFSALVLAGIAIAPAMRVQADPVRRSAIPGEIVVCFDSDTDRVDLNATIGAWNLPAIDGDFVVEASRTILQWRRPGRDRFTNVVLIKFPQHIESAGLLNHLDSLDGIEWSAPNTACTGDVKELIPNDPQYGSQYHHPLMQNHLAWDITLGDPGVIIAVTDDGVDIDHVDLIDNVWTNQGEIPGNGIDDDNNGFIDDVHGWDFVFNNNDPNPNSAGDDHGTHVAGICCARTDNAIGVSGTAGRATVMPIQFFSSGQPWTAANIAASYAYAVDNGARIITTSYNINGWVGDPTFTAGLQYLYDQGGLHFNSAGNGNQLNPARQAFHQTFLAASTDSGDVRSSFSNYGTGIDFAAPGSSIYSTILNDLYGTKSGTSMASPNAAGVAALIWSANPAWTRAQVVAQMHAGADNIDAQNPGFVGWLGAGRVNAFAALTAGTLPPPQVSQVIGLPPDGGAISVPGNTFTMRFDQIMAPATVNDMNAFSMIYAGPDTVFGTGDDVALPLTWSPYLLASNEIVLTIGGPALVGGRYRVIADASIIENPFGTQLDGDGNGVAGDSWITTFAVCIGATTPSCLTCVGDMNANILANGQDLSAFVACVIDGNPAAPGCGCADMDLNGVINQTDVALLVELLMDVPRGACCMIDGTCAELSAMGCAGVSGIFQGDHTVCPGLICPQPCAPTAVAPLPFSVNFDSDPTCSTSCNAACGMTGWINDTGDSANWIVDAGGTPSSNTGPSAAHSGANYVYVETSSPCFNIEANLISPTLDFSAFANPQIEFFYHAYGSEIVELNVQVSTDNCLSWSTEFQLLGQQQLSNGDPWLQAVVDLSAYAGMSNLRIRFNYLSGPSFHGDIAIDTIIVRNN